FSIPASSKRRRALQPCPAEDPSEISAGQIFYPVRGFSAAMISFSNVSKQHGRQVLFVDASFQLNPGEKVGLVGPNGSGKTTLFRMIVGEESAEEGTISVPKKISIGYFRQDVEEMSGRSVLDESIA